MEVMEALLNRRSIRSFKPEQITDEELNIVLEAARYAPSGSNLQRAYYVVVQDPATRKKIAEMNAAVMNGSGDPYYGAPTVILAFGELGERGTPVEDTCLGLGNMYTAAYSIGLGSIWINRTREMFQTEEGKALLKEWGIEKDLIGVGSCALGYPDGPHPEAKPRKEDFVTFIK